MSISFRIGHSRNVYAKIPPTVYISDSQLPHSYNPTQPCRISLEPSPSATSALRSLVPCPTVRASPSSPRGLSDAERSRVRWNCSRQPTCWLTMRPIFTRPPPLRPRRCDRPTTRKCHCRRTVSVRPSPRRMNRPGRSPRSSPTRKHHTSQNGRLRSQVIRGHLPRRLLLPMHPCSQDEPCRIPNDRIKSWLANALCRGWNLRH